MGCLHLGTRRPSIVDAARWAENVASRVRLGKVADMSTSFRDEKAKSDALCSAFPRACWAKWQAVERERELAASTCYPIR